MAGGTFVSLKDVDHDYRRFFEMNVTPGDRFLGSADGSKLIHYSNPKRGFLLWRISLFRTAPTLTFKIEQCPNPEQ